MAWNYFIENFGHTRACQLDTVVKNVKIKLIASYCSPEEEHEDCWIEKMIEPTKLAAIKNLLSQTSIQSSSFIQNPSITNSIN